MIKLEEELIARKSFWRRSGEALQQLTAISAGVYSLVLSKGTKMDFSQIKAKLINLKDHANSLSQVLNVFVVHVVFEKQMIIMTSL